MINEQVIYNLSTRFSHLFLYLLAYVVLFIRKFVTAAFLRQIEGGVKILQRTKGVKILAFIESGELGELCNRQSRFGQNVCYLLSRGFVRRGGGGEVGVVRACLWCGVKRGGVDVVR